MKPEDAINIDVGSLILSKIDGATLSMKELTLKLKYGVDFKDVKFYPLDVDTDAAWMKKYCGTVYASGGPIGKRGISGSDTLSVLNAAIPGFEKMRVKYPAQHAEGDEMNLPLAIICLNDKDKWSREQIADWLEGLDLDLTIRSNNE